MEVLRGKPGMVYERVEQDFCATRNWMGTDPTERAFFRDFRDVNHQNDLGIG